MRSWESVLLIMLAIVMVMMIKNRNQSFFRFFRMLLPFPLAVHFVTEGFRWQMVPAYLCTLYAFVTAVLTLFKRERMSPIRLGLISTIGLLLICWALPYLIPVPSLEAPSGNNPVGTVMYHWIDTSRLEQTPGETNKYREMNVQIWYPAQLKGSMRQAPYIPELTGLSHYAKQRWHIPSFFLNYIRLAKTYTYMEADIASNQSQYPVVIFSHGWPGSRYAYHYLVTDLASKGYVVAVVEHTYGTLATVFPDGRIMSQKAPSEFQLPAWDSIIDNVWAEDDRFVLDQLEKLNRGIMDKRFTQRLNLEETAIAGHSFGGDAALATLRKDKRFKVGISLDGSFYGSIQSPIAADQSFLWMCTDNYLNDLGLPKPSDKQLSEEGIQRAVYKGWVDGFHRRRDQAVSEGGQILQLKGVKHSSFSDLFLYSPFLQWKAKAPDPKQSHRLILKYVELYLDQHLKGQPSGELFEEKSQEDSRVLLNP